MYLDKAVTPTEELTIESLNTESSTLEESTTVTLSSEGEAHRLHRQKFQRRKPFKRNSLKQELQ